VAQGVDVFSSLALIANPADRLPMGCSLGGLYGLLDVCQWQRRVITVRWWDFGVDDRDPLPSFPVGAFDAEIFRMPRDCDAPCPIFFRPSPTLASLLSC